MESCSERNTALELRRLLEQYGKDRLAICKSVRFRDSRGRLGSNETPVATLEGIVEIVLLLSGSRAAAVRKQVVQVFVRYLGGDDALVDSL